MCWIINLQANGLTDKRRLLALRSIYFTIIAGQLYKKGLDQIIGRCVLEHEKQGVLQEAHKGNTRGHEGKEGTVRKVLQARLWWPILSRDAHIFTTH